MELQKILILNAKKSSGKTTIATNLATSYANKERHPALLDYDPQGSALNWLQTHDANCTPIHNIEAHKRNVAVTRS